MDNSRRISLLVNSERPIGQVGNGIDKSSPSLWSLIDVKSKVQPLGNVFSRKRDLKNFGIDLHRNPATQLTGRLQGFFQKSLP